MAMHSLGGSRSENRIKGKKTIDVVTARYASLQRPKVPLLVFGGPQELIDFSIDIVKEILSVIPIGVDLSIRAESLHELIELYFKDSTSFLSLVGEGLLIIRMGAEVANQGCVRTIEAILHHFVYGHLYPIFQTSVSSNRFFSHYPTEMKDVFNTYKISIVEL